MPYDVRIIGSIGKGSFLQILDVVDAKATEVKVHVTAVVGGEPPQRTYRDVALRLGNQEEAKQIAHALSALGYRAVVHNG